MEEEVLKKKREYFREYYRKNRDKFKKANETYWKKKVEKEESEKEVDGDESNNKDSC